MNYLLSSLGTPWPRTNSILLGKSAAGVDIGLLANVYISNATGWPHPVLAGRLFQHGLITQELCEEPEQSQLFFISMVTYGTTGIEEIDVLRVFQKEMLFEGHWAIN